MYFKASINSVDRLSIFDTTSYDTPGEAVFSPSEVEEIEAVGCQPVIVRIIRKFKSVRDVSWSEV